MQQVYRLLPLILIAACGPETIGPTADDDIVRSRLTAATIQMTFSRQGEHWVSPVLEVPRAATVVGAMFESTGPVQLEVRALDTWAIQSPWLPLTETWHEGRYRVARADLNDVAWSAQLRLPATEVDTVIELIWSPVVPRPPSQPQPHVVQPSRHALLPNLEAWNIRSRAAWQARSPSCSAEDTHKSRLAVHHTAGSPGDPSAYDAKLRQIQAFHMDTNGWCDIGYHFLVSLDGTVWEGRELFDVGAHIGEHNRANIGLSFMGCFHPSSDCDGITPQTPPDVMVTAGGEVIGVLAHMYELPIDSDTVKGHRDFSGTATACPGDNLSARLADLRAIAVATLAEFENECGCDSSSACDASCSCDPQCEQEKEDGGCAAASATPFALLSVAIARMRRRRRV